MNCKENPFQVDRFADLQILRYTVDGFEQLTLRQKILVYYLSEAALQGRDILFDQNGACNLAIRQVLETIYQGEYGDRQSADFQAFETYLKQVWFANGIHHHYSMDKFTPAFSPDFLRDALMHADASKLPLRDGQTAAQLFDELYPIIFDPTVIPKRVNQADNTDLVTTSACHYYAGGVTQAEVEAYYARLKQPADPTPPAYGLNSRLVKEHGVVREKVWREGGLYGEAISHIVHWLDQAIEVAESDNQREVIRALIDFYRTGDLKTFDRYAILWVSTDDQVDFVNGFTETYGDPLGMKASWEALVNFKDEAATRRTRIISQQAQWFEDHSPVDADYKKEKVTGVSAKVITAAILGGDLYPSTAIGINLPNSNWIRTQHGSKSVTIGNITDAYRRAAHGNGFREEFVYSQTELDLLEQYADVTDDLHTDLHECVGHGSGRLLPGVDPDALKAYGATIEEARADLFGLYYMADAQLVQWGLLPDEKAYQAEYYSYLMNGLMTQLVRIEPGRCVEESHMRNRQLIAHWVFERGQDDRVVEFVQRENGKTYVRVNNYQQLRQLFGQLLAEIQRIKSTGDYAAARHLVEKYGVQVDADLHREVLQRYQTLHLAPYKGFINPRYEAITDENGQITDVTVSYTEGYAEQMLRYSRDYHTLPCYND